MAEYISVKEAARLWNITDRSVTGLCRAGRIEGAYKNGRDWLIPANAEKPADKRVKTGTYKRSRHTARLPLPVGVSDYRLASTEYYYIDKTLMIRDFLDERPMVPVKYGTMLRCEVVVS